MILEKKKIKEELKKSNFHIIRAPEKKKGEINDLFQENFPDPKNINFQNERLHQMLTIKMTQTTTCGCEISGYQTLEKCVTHKDSGLRGSQTSRQ